LACWWSGWSAGINPRWRLFHGRVNAVAWLAGLGLFGLLLRFGYLQVVESGRYRAAAEDNSVRLYPVQAPRGDITDRNGEVLVTNRPSFRASLMPKQLPADDDAREAAVNRLVRLLDLDPGWLAGRLAEAYESPLTPVRLMGGLSVETVANLEERRNEIPGLVIEEEPVRVYRYGTLASHVLGYIGEISLDELKDLGGSYVPGDLLGKTGVELAAERYLRGRNGGIEVEVDAQGRQVKLRRRRPPVPGNRVTLTIDRRLQERCEELLGSRGGAVVMMEAKTGEILAMATSPRFDPNWFAGGRITLGRWRKLLDDPRTPLLNRATQMLYSPGSIFKIVTATAALELGELTPEKTYQCEGTFWIKVWSYKCWNETGSHGWLNVEQALIHSCDIFFYKTGLSLNVDRLAKYAELFGFGEPAGLDIPGEKGGHVPSRAWKERLFHIPWFPGNTVQMSIGQGYLLSTPLQLVQLLDLVALEGRAMRPHIMRKVVDEQDRMVMEVTPQVTRRISIAPSTWALVKRGLYGCVNFATGTGYRAHIPYLKVSGKTSTVQNPQGEDHAAFAAFAPSDDPEVVVAVFVEHGLAGGVIGAQIAKSALEAWAALRQGRPIPGAVEAQPSRAPDTE